jgi:MarR family transcriptional regulator, organic hydroperoxide resistance regulator
MDKMNLDEKVEGIEQNFRRASWKTKLKGREILSEFDITPPQFNALLTLNAHENLTIGELSQKMYLACSTVTDLLDRMERNELVERVKDEKDRRVVRIKVLKKGLTVIEGVLENRRCYIKENLDGLTDDMIDSVYEVMAMLNEKMDI